MIPHIPIAQKKRTIAASGFTLLELMVTITIVVLVTAIIMIQYSSFNSSVLLASQAYNTAFDIRETQSLAISVHGFDGNFYSAYGVYFDTLATDPNAYILFQDDISNGAQDPVEYQAGEEVGQPYHLGSRFKFVNICVSTASGRTCEKDDPSTTGETVDASLHDLAISFVRPNFDAKLYSSSIPGVTGAELFIGTNDNAIYKKVVIYSTGQISVE